MSGLPIHFFTEDIQFVLKEKIHIRKWIKQTIHAEGKKLRELNFIFCSDDYLLGINQQYLQHNTFTDIVTFDNAETPGSIQGDIFISIDRVRDNAHKFKVSERDELHRVIIHGTLHLLGFTDKSKSDKKLMTQKEDQYLDLRSF